MKSFPPTFPLWKRVAGKEGDTGNYFDNSDLRRIYLTPQEYTQKLRQRQEFHSLRTRPSLRNRCQL